MLSDDIIHNKLKNIDEDYMLVICNTYPNTEKEIDVKIEEKDGIVYLKKSNLKSNLSQLKSYLNDDFFLTLCYNNVSGLIDEINVCHKNRKIYFS